MIKKDQNWCSYCLDVGENWSPLLLVNCAWLRLWPAFALSAHRKYQVDICVGFYWSPVDNQLHVLVIWWSSLIYVIGRYNQPFKPGLAFHTTHVVCVNFIHEERGDLQFKVDSERQIFEKLFMVTLRDFAKSLLRASCRRKYIFFILILMSDLWFEPRLRLHN